MLKMVPKLRIFITCAMVWLLSGCVILVAETQSNESILNSKMKTNISLDSKAQRDYLVLRADMHSMNGDWIKAQMDLESAIAIEPSGELQLRHALILAQKGQLEDSEKKLYEVLKFPEMKKNTEAYLALGEVQALQNNVEASLDSYKKVLTLDPLNYKAIIFLGAIYSQVKDLDQAKSYFKKLDAIAEHKHLSGYYLGRLEQQSENFKNSENYFEKCLAIKPDFTDCIFSLVESLTLQKRNERAIQKLEAFIEQNPDSDRAFAKLYDLYLEQNNQEKAFNQLVQLERFEPQNRFIKMQMALHMIEKNEYDAAIKKLNEVVELSPDFGKTYFLLSTIYERKGDVKKSKYYYSKIPRNQPVYIEASIQRAKDIENIGNAKAALKFLKSIDNSLADTRVDLYIAILQSKLGMSAQSISTLRRVALKNPNDVQVIYFLGHLEGEAGQMGRAILNMKRVIQLDSEHSDALNYLAFYYAENKIMLDEAERYALKALKLKPDDGHYSDTLGWIYFQKGQLELAQKYLEIAYKIHPEEPVIAEHLAAVYSEKGLNEKAKQVYTNLIDKGLGDREKLKRQINSISSEK